MNFAKKKTELAASPISETKKPSLTLIDEKNQSIVDKAEIERIRKILSEKMKDPNFVKKASMIIAEMLSNK